MMRIMTTILALGLVVVLPALCAAGAIAHPCNCGPAAGCHHESDCADDPCGNDVVVSRSQGRHIDSALPIAIAATCGVSSNAAADTLASANVDAEAPPGVGFPLHASDVPLLI